MASDGWYDGSAAPIEPPDTAVFGWLNFDDTDTIVSPTTAVAVVSNQPMWLINVVDK